MLKIGDRIVIPRRAQRRKVARQGRAGGRAGQAARRAAAPRPAGRQRRRRSRRPSGRVATPAASRPAPSEAGTRRRRRRFRWPAQRTRHRGLRPQAQRPAERRHQHRAAGRHAGQGGRGRRRRLCRQRAQGLRQSACWCATPNGYVTAYAHAKELLVKRGDPIKRGQMIAQVRPDRQRRRAAAALRDPQGPDAARSRCRYLDAAA